MLVDIEHFSETEIQEKSGSMKIVAEGLLIRNGTLLLAHRAAHKKLYPSCWSFPGGHVERGETVERALKRELLEELGIEVTSYHLLTVIKDPCFDVVYHIYLIEDWAGPVVNRGDEHSELSWVRVDQAASMPDLALDAYLDLFEML